MEAARTKMAAAFEFFEKLGVPYFCFHDHDVAPTGSSFAEETANLNELADDMAAHMERTGVGLLWGTARLFGHLGTWPVPPPTRTPRSTPVRSPR